MKDDIKLSKKRKNGRNRTDKKYNLTDGLTPRKRKKVFIRMEERSENFCNNAGKQNHPERKKK